MYPMINFLLLCMNILIKCVKIGLKINNNNYNYIQNKINEYFFKRP